MLTELDKEWLNFTTNKTIHKKDERKKFLETKLKKIFLIFTFLLKRKLLI